MKGFIKVLEAVIASAILLTAMTFFFTETTKQTNWDRALLQVRAQDTLFTLAKNGSLQKAVAQNDATGINSIIDGNPIFMLPPTVEYSLEVRGIPPPVIYVTCLCNPAEKTKLDNLLAPMDITYHNRAVSFRTEIASINTIRNETDVVVAFSSGRFAPSLYVDPTGTEIIMNRTLENASFVLIGIVGPEGGTTAPGTGDQYFKKIFNLTRRSGGGPAQGEFVNDENASSFRVAKYYANLSNMDFDNPFFSSVQFSFATGSEIRQNENTVLMTQGGSQYSHMQFNDNILNGDGRTVWIEDFNEVADTRFKNLTKSAMLWASGESFKLDNIEKIPKKAFTTASILLYDWDVYQVRLIVWRAFQ